MNNKELTWNQIKYNGHYDSGNQCWNLSAKITLVLTDFESAGIPEDVVNGFLCSLKLTDSEYRLILQESYRRQVLATSDTELLPLTSKKLEEYWPESLCGSGNPQVAKFIEKMDLTHPGEKVWKNLESEIRNRLRKLRLEDLFQEESYEGWRQILYP